MMIDDGLLFRFFLNKCTEKEALAVEQYLKEHPEKLDQYLSEQDWEETENQHVLPAEKKAALLQIIKDQANISEQKIRLASQQRERGFELVMSNGAIRWGLSVAAVLFLVLGWWISANNTIPYSTEKNEPAIFTLVQINYGKDDMKLNIADGSVIYLKPGGEVRYLEQLGKNSRDFKLKGAARFKVAEDKTRPFNVYAAGTVTTALGTDFTVSTAENDNQISVLLHSGKVVVAPDSSIKIKDAKKTYLLPGNKLLINRENFKLTLLKDSRKMDRDYRMVGSKRHTELSAIGISFKNEPLDKIFRVLQSNFSATIQYDTDQVKGMYFTGVFKRDSNTVALILNEIALLNHLKIEKKDSIYVLAPQPDRPSAN